MGCDVRMLTAFGDDVYGQKIAASCAELGIDISHALRLSDTSTSTYLYIADENGDMALAVSDMAICDRITPAYLAANLPLLQNAQIVIADTNNHRNGARCPCSVTRCPPSRRRSCGPFFTGSIR